MYESALEHASGAIELVYRLDVGDPTARQYHPPEPAIRVDGKRVVMSALWNDCWNVARADIAMHCGDDIRFRTPGWDQLVVDAFEAVPDRIAFVHGRDGYQDAGLGTHGFLHRRWIEAVGYFVPPLFTSDYNDLWLHTVAEAIGRRVYLPDLYTEHLHPAAGKGEWDRTHRERLTRADRTDPGKVWLNTEAERVADADKLRAVMVDTPAPTWSILIASVGERSAELGRLLDVLGAQTEPYGGDVEVVVWWDKDRSHPLGEVRQALLEHSRAAYVSFVDDDDEVPAYYVDRVMGALAQRPGYVGWRQQLYVDGAATKPTFHSLRYSDWWDDEHGYYRHVSHLNPIRRSLAMRGRFDRQVPEDVDWAHQVYAAVRSEAVSEVFIDEVMYLYRFDPSRSLWRKRRPRPGAHKRPTAATSWSHVHFHPRSDP